MAVLERVAFHRVVYIIERNNLMNPNQFGFVPRRGRFELISRVFELIFKQKMRAQLNRTTTTTSNAADVTLVSLDINGAFDTVDQNILTEKIITNFGPKETISVW